MMIVEVTINAAATRGNARILVALNVEAIRTVLPYLVIISAARKARVRVVSA